MLPAVIGALVHCAYKASMRQIHVLNFERMKTFVTSQNYNISTPSNATPIRESSSFITAYV
jgi:hypothetical protein